ncbi:MAG: aldose 1-epimerase [Mycobacterium sp.]|nr:aldose 1-epimerase [Mycobacterium sp.]
MRTVTLHDPAGDVRAKLVPQAGMIAVSLTDGGTELLGQRRGLQTYVSAGKTMGIPVLYPWANRLSANTYQAGGEIVDIAPDARGVRADGNGLPIHGLLAAYPDWRIVTESPNDLLADLDFGAKPDLLASFPFPHIVELGVQLSDRTLTVTTIVTATGDKAVPLCFGFHPYLVVPGVPRAEWVIETPPMRHLAVDERGLPTGASAPHPGGSQVLGDKAFDDGYDEVADGAVFAVSGGDRRIELTFRSGYHAAQIFAPPAEDLICFEPMAAPTDALVTGAYKTARPGESAVAQFSIRV